VNKSTQRGENEKKKALYQTPKRIEEEKVSSKTPKRVRFKGNLLESIKEPKKKVWLKKSQTLVT